MNTERMKKSLLELINNKREEMIETANREGYTSVLAVQCSQDLDKLLNEYQRLLLNEQKPKRGAFQHFVPNMKLFSFQDTFSY
ncbi:aspartyl-phosphate phosphatase Spo0E family protein [Metabacillus halosaccharovorans]|uniref:aspartyl-phosphate phosphatase Spo0E family protein n=1 Tax=Metabacillus halosaccharovorans TaxID=930124 RepID=UPI001C1FB39F|nr:aspartyl-phosphate phosphatase Spo0E family protein [Metabacillus halosaccharovorans]MBU7591833.1 aspartyl-phosphate phosphatase Spo0E family protein [Metabacillus halosaccharovorans]